MSDVPYSEVATLLGMPTPPEAWRILDSTKLQSFLTCERQFFWEHVLGWKPEQISNHLIFGQAFHHALESLIRGGLTDEALTEGYERFLAHYRMAGFSEDTDAIYYPKTPARALEALIAYVQRYASDAEKYEVLHTEVSGGVGIGEGRHLHFRWDTVLRERDTGLVVSQEHKTGSSTWNWAMQWALKLQIDNYTFGLHRLYDPKEVKGVEVNGIFFLKNSGARGGKTIDFMRVPCYRTIDRMHAWYWTLHDTIDRLEFEFERLATCQVSETVMMAFPMRTESCAKYTGCPYHDLCCTWANPLAQLTRIPPGFIIEHWDPRTLEARERIEL